MHYERELVSFTYGLIGSKEHEPRHDSNTSRDSKVVSESSFKVGSEDKVPTAGFEENFAKMNLSG